MSGEQELSLGGASSSPDRQSVTTEIVLGAPILQPWGPVVLAEPRDPSDPVCVPKHDEQPFVARGTLAQEAPQLRKVLIEEVVVPSRGGRPRGKENYPFAALTPVAPNASGELSGNCIFIPYADEPRKHIANARKRYRDWVFITRSTSGGKMIWRQR